MQRHHRPSRQTGEFSVDAKFLKRQIVGALTFFCQITHVGLLYTSWCFYFHSLGINDTFTVTFICNQSSYPGQLRFVHEEINSARRIYNTFFEFHTALACPPSPVDCQVTGK